MTESVFEKIVVGHKFIIKGIAPEKAKEKGIQFHCALCGGYGNNYVVIERDDGQRYLIGKTCLSRVGLEWEPKKPYTEITVSKSSQLASSTKKEAASKVAKKVEKPIPPKPKAQAVKPKEQVAKPKKEVSGETKKSKVEPLAEEAAPSDDDIEDIFDIL